MSMDQMSALMELRPINTNRNSTSSQETSFPLGSSHKVKFLCSFGGKIFLRPSVGVLRYAGGHTRIIAVDRQATFPEFYGKMADVYGGPVRIRYQLPDQGLDVLISVLTSEDLENMMDEYDKMADACSDGSAKLRIFLFAPSEISLAAAQLSAAGQTVANLLDEEQRYMDAINGVEAVAIESGVGFDGIRHIEQHDSSRTAFLGNATSEKECQNFRINSTVVGQTNLTAQTLYPLPLSYASQAWVDSQHASLICSSSLAMAAVPPMVNVLVPERNCKAFQQPVSHLPPLYPSNTQAKNVEHYSLQPLSLEQNQQGFRSENGEKCVNSLPQAQSDTVLNNPASFPGFSTSEACSFQGVEAIDPAMLVSGITREAELHAGRQ